MPKFEFKITEKYTTYQTIEADCKDAAYDIIGEMLVSGEIDPQADWGGFEQDYEIIKEID